MGHKTHRTLTAAVLVLALLLVVTLGIAAAVGGRPACAAPSPPRPPAPAYRAPSAPKVPAYRPPAAPRPLVSRPTVYRTRYEQGRPVVYPVIVPVDDDYGDCD
ncbi:hypothetical protein ACGFI9_21890 [Micromonospora sp. NPDC048930]|uniref:hypothetical protein n=1 Tax=Micromonospora sp. NPDC048930 TaxID=3364261 RepID=UPI0037164D0F